MVVQKIVKNLFFTILIIFIFSLVGYVHDDEIKNTVISPGDQLIIDLFKDK